MQKKINKLVLDKMGWPVEHFKGMTIINFLRDLIHGRSVVCRDCWYQTQATKAPGVGLGSNAGMTSPQ